MFWARDAGAGSHRWIRSARSSLTVTTRVMAAWMVADPIAGRDSKTSSDVIAGIVTATSIVVSVVEIDGAIMISNTTDGGDGDRHS